MNTLKNFDEKFSKYIGFAFSLLLIWLIKRDSIILATHVFSMSSLVSLFIIGELIGKRKNTINKPLLICVLTPNLVITITAVILQLLNPSNEVNQYLYVTRAIAIILTVTLPISYWMLYTEKEKAK
ncbi:MAG: hypothetical protein HXL96_01120 [[Eubacterium] sulci]|nr:hypothetical protein [[Eubacterium] sulci]